MTLTRTTLRSLVVVLLLLTATRLSAREFEAQIPSGQTLQFSTSGSNATVVGIVGGQNAGHVSVPATIADGGSTFAVVGIGMRAFVGCTTLTHITLAEGVRQVGAMAFSGCTALDTLSLPSTLTSIGTAAFNQTAFAQNAAHWADGLLVADHYLLALNPSLLGSEVAVPEGTLGVAAYAAGSTGAGVSKLSLPASLRFVGDMAFSGFTALDTLFLAALTPPTLGYDVFVSDQMQVVVPCEVRDLYLAATRWNALQYVECPNVGIGEAQPQHRPRAWASDGLLTAEGPCVVYDVMGRRVAYAHASGLSRFLLPRGLYVVAFPSAPSLAVVVR